MKPAFSTQKQKLLIEYLISHTDTFIRCRSILRSKYFDPELRSSVAFILQYYEQFSGVPSPQQIAAETNDKFTIQQLNPQDLDYCCTEIEKFCKFKAVEHAIINAAAKLNDGNCDNIEQELRDALTISLDRNLGLDYFDDPLGRLEKLAETPLRTSTGYECLDDLLGGGLAETEMIMFCANSGGGKSVHLTNLCVNYISQGHDVLYISLELSEKMISQRLDLMFTGVTTSEVNAKYQQVAEELNRKGKSLGRFVIKELPVNSNANAIRAYLKEYQLAYGKLPKLMAVDYIDIMSPNDKVSADNVSEKDKRTSEELREIGRETGMIIASASQLNRSAINATELNQSHTAGGLTKVNTVDWQFAITQTPTMKAEGITQLTCLKARSSDATGKSIELKQAKNLRISSKKNQAANMQTLISSKNDSVPVKRSLLDIMSD